MRDFWGDKLPLKERIVKYIKLLDDYIDELKSSKTKDLFRIDVRSSLDGNNKRAITASISVAWNASINFGSIDQIDEMLKHNKIVEEKLIELRTMMQKEIDLTK